jgi:prepilin-type N-terminal cleavage/methylation domain
MKSLPRLPRMRSGAFTLIELLTVIAIIAILASLILATSGFVQEKAGRSRAQAEIAAIESALELYKIDNGDFPEGNGGTDSTRDLLQALHPKDGKIYIEQMRAFEYKSPSDSAYYNRNRLIDPFGQPYRYFYQPGESTNKVTGKQHNGPVSPDIWSYGKDGPTRNASKPEKWITNW